MTIAIDPAQLLRVISDAVIVADASGKIVWWNAAATRIFGFAEEEALGKDLALIIPERLRHRHNVGFGKSMETGTTRYGAQLLKVPAVHKDGRSLSIAFSVGMLFDANNTVTGVAAVIRDETSRFQADRELAQRLAACEATLAALSKQSSQA
jgi:PAS domain S-box-containing protein